MANDDIEAATRKTLAALSAGYMRDSDSEGKAFAIEHRAWLDRNPWDPLYCLPDAAIDRLRRPRLGTDAPLDVAAAAAERDLRNLCRRHHAVGFSDGRPIAYPYLSMSRPPTFRETFAGWELSEEQLGLIAAYEPSEAVGRSINLRAKGYAGWLLTEPAFLEEVGVLASRRRALPEGERPSFPLQRSGPFLARVLGVQPPPAREAPSGFAADLESFLDRWGLVGMSSWELPEPQGPLVLEAPPPGSPATPRHGLHIVLPIHYALTAEEELLRHIRERQRGMAADLGLDRSMAGLPRYKAYATIFEVAHLESVLMGRFRSSWRRKGFVGLVVEAIAESVGIDVDQVKKCRKAIKASRRGGRKNISYLRVAD
jgi:hypothetical protein